MPKRFRLMPFLLLFMISAAIAIAGCTADSKPALDGAAIPVDELDPAAWGKSYPLQYASYLKNNEAAKTEFGGSVKESKFIAEPEIKELFKGYGFSIDYNEDRGHTKALEDMTATKRVNAKTPGSCLTCKTPSAPRLIQEMGMAYYTTPVLTLAKNTMHSIACADCHDPKTMDLKVTRPAFIAAMKERGIDVSAASRNDMRTYVCGQCHVEYYFQTETKEVTYPWADGVEPNQIEQYYEKMNFSDWEHPDSRAPMRKVQHPEFETWSSGIHGSAGVTCADCHMPYTRENGMKYSSHWWTSPLKTIDVSCQTCHQQDAQWLKDRVLNTQSKTFAMQQRAGQLIVEAHQTIKNALANPAADVNKIKTAQSLAVKAQWYWDWVAAENSRGFHNPVQAINSVGLAVDYAHQAKDAAASSVR